MRDLKLTPDPRVNPSPSPAEPRPQRRLYRGVPRRRLAATPCIAAPRTSAVAR